MFGNKESHSYYHCESIDEVFDRLTEVAVWHSAMDASIGHLEISKELANKLGMERLQAWAQQHGVQIDIAG